MEVMDLSFHLKLEHKSSQTMYDLNTSMCKIPFQLIDKLFSGKELLIVTCFHEVSIKSLVCIWRYCLSNMPHDNIETQEVLLKGLNIHDQNKGLFQHIIIILKRVFWRV